MFKTKSGIIIPAKENLVPISLNGNDGDIYRYLNYCIKFLRTEPNMSIEKLEYLIKYISHELLLIPVEAVYENNEYKAYLTKYIKDLKLKSLKCNTFLECIEALRECFTLFTKNNIEAFDTHGKNIIVNEKIYLIDFDRFQFYFDDDLVTINNRYYQDLIFDMIKWSFLESFVNESVILPYASMNNSSNAEYPFDKWIRENKNKQDVINFFAKELREYKTMEEYFLDREEYILKKCLSI